MDRINGHSLEEAWKGLGWFKTIKLALQLRRFVRSMREIKSPTRGALTTGICPSIWLADYYGPPPHATCEALASYLNYWIIYHPKGQPTPGDYLLVLPTPLTFAFTHQDLALRNILVDHSNQLWVVDWQYAGWHPEYFEYMGMTNFDTIKMFNHCGSRLRWSLFTLLSVGNHVFEVRLWGVVAYKSSRFPIARKTLVLPKGAHPDALQLRLPGM
jgi:Phosphotransferase enzyme family